MFQHELDHLHGVLMFDRMTPEQRREAMAEYRRLQEGPRLQLPLQLRAAASACADRRPVRLAFLGTPEMAVPPLRGLVAAGHEVVLVVTRADRRRGRGSATSPSPVKAAAAELGLPSPTTSTTCCRPAPSSASSSPTGGSSSRTCWPLCRWSTCTSRCCPGGAGRRRSSERCWPAISTTGVCIMDVEETLDTRRRLRLPRGADRSGDDRGRAAGGPRRAGHGPARRRPRCAVASAPTAGRARSPTPRRSHPKSCSSCGIGRRSSSTVGSVSVERGRRSAGAA